MAHTFRFFRVGGVDQVVIDSAEDLRHLPELDFKLWTALAMPTRGVDLDPRTLDLVDADGDGRIRAPEVLAAVRFAVDNLTDPECLFDGGTSLPLTGIVEGPLRNGARCVLDNLGKPDASVIDLADIIDTARIFAATRFNGDGVITADSADDAATRKVIEEIAETQGTVPDRSGKPGIDRPRVEAFFAQVRALDAWRARGLEQAAILPLGEATAEAASAMATVESKIDDFFTRCRLVAFDPRTAAHFEPLQGLQPQGGTTVELAIGAEQLKALPLARAEANRALPLNEGVNPGWMQPLAVFVQKAALPLLGTAKPGLTEEEWAALKEKLAPYRAWQASKPIVAVEKLGAERVRELAGGKLEAALLALIERDVALQEENAQLTSLEKLLRLRRDLIRLVRNFVNMADFYTQRDGVFQAGTLWIDGRACSLCVEVADAAKHATLAAMSATCLAYCDCTRPNGEKKTIVAAVTDGDSENLFVGRNGVFFDRAGRDWDATVTRLVSNPISVREAFWAPYKKLVRFVEEQVAKRAAAASEGVDKELGGVVTGAVEADKPKPPPKKVDVGTVAAIGVAVGGIGAMVTGLVASFLGLGFWMPVGLLGLVLAISLPSVILAWLKLRRRNIGPILDANGWAVNGRARINVPFGRRLTTMATLPKGAMRTVRDPYAKKKRPWIVWAVVVVVVAAGAVAGAWYWVSRKP